MREYLVSPALIMSRSQDGGGIEGLSEKARGKLPDHGNASLADVRYERVSDSALAGVLAGGTLSGFLREFPSTETDFNGMRLPHAEVL